MGKCWRASGGTGSEATPGAAMNTAEHLGHLGHSLVKQ